MKILIIGEYSGFSFNLKKGFDLLGYECLVVHEGDAWKNFISKDNYFNFNYKINFKILKREIRYSWIFRSLFLSIKFYFFKKKLNDFDRVLIINQEFIRLNNEIYLPKICINDLLKMKKRGAKIYLSACGDDRTYINYLNKSNNPLFKFYSKSKFFLPKFIKIENYLNNLICGIIPVMYDYAVAYREQSSINHIKIYKTIPLPYYHFQDKTNFDIKKSEKVTIMYGKNRDSKGYKYIKNGVEKLNERYSEKINIIETNKEPYESYLEKIKLTDILIDQCFSDSYGLNAIIGLSNGKVVLSGNTLNNQIEFNTKNIPVINIEPNSMQIFQILENLILERKKLEELKIESKLYFEKFHNAECIARKYLKIFSN